jgi:RTX calcium-binding nonapeptide repeat (4 copies)
MRTWLSCITILAAILTASSAFAMTDCPYPYDGAVDCNIASISLDACWYDAADGNYKCNRFANGAETIWAVSDGDKVWAWGHCRTEDFCCSYDYTSSVPPIYITMLGGDDEAYLFFGDTLYYEGYSDIFMGAGDDIVLASRYTSCTFPCDDIDMGTGDRLDYVEAYAGDDQVAVASSGAAQLEAYGGDGCDKLLGGDNLDILYGEDDEDVIYGYGEHDHCYGGNNTDWVNGGDDSDDVFGGAGDDNTANNGAVCGGAGQDNVDGEGGTDSCADSHTDTFTSCNTPYLSVCPAAPW